MLFFFFRSCSSRATALKFRVYVLEHRGSSLQSSGCKSLGSLRLDLLGLGVSGTSRTLTKL